MLFITLFWLRFYVESEEKMQPGHDIAHKIHTDIVVLMEAAAIFVFNSIVFSLPLY